MSPEKQRIAIAEACGWRHCRLDNPMGEPKTGPIGLPQETPEGVEIWEHLTSLPDYLNDLNAMHEAEKVLAGSWSIPPTGQVLAYHHAMIDLAVRDDLMVLHATAAQRAEAFLRTLGKWEDT